MEIVKPWWCLLYNSIQKINKPTFLFIYLLYEMFPSLKYNVKINIMFYMVIQE